MALLNERAKERKEIFENSLQTEIMYSLHKKEKQK